MARSGERGARMGAPRLLLGLGWPIVQKEIRADFRKYAFFFTHLICLCALGAGVLYMVATSADRPDVKPEKIGRDIFNTFFIIQCLVVVVVFPAFSANALSEERTARTFDLLITSDLRPGEIVSGKFLASSLYCLIYIIATVPLLSISLLFAGVTLTEIGAAYAFLIGLMALISMTGVFVSSCFSSNIRATFTVYVVSFALTALGWFQWGPAFGASTSPLAVLEDRWQPLAGIALVAFAYLFLFTENRIRARADDHSSKLRVLTLGVLLGAAAIETRSIGSGQISPEGFQTDLLLASSALFLVGLFSTSETAWVPRRVRARFARLGLTGPLLRLFAPGSFRGLLYSTALTAAAVLFLAWLGKPLLGRGPAAPGATGGPPLFGEALLTLPIYLYAFFSLGFFLSSLDFTPLYTRLTVTFVFIITCLLPVIFWLGERPDGILSLYYLSPATIWTSLKPLEPSAEGPKFVLWGAPVVRVAQGLFGGLGVLFTVLGVRSSLRKGYPLLRYAPPPLPQAEPPAEAPASPVAASEAAAEASQTAAR